MIFKEEIYEWFKGAVSSQRIDLVCSLLRLCLPLELRFVGSCLEDLARKDYISLREYELKSNDSSGYAALMADSTTEELQNTLNIYVSLLRSTNTVCANRLFHILEDLNGRLQLTLTRSLSLDTEDSRSTSDEKMADDCLLLFTMAGHHPAFTFSQRLKISSIMKSMKNLLGELNQIRQSQKERSAAISSSELSSLPIVSNTSKVRKVQSPSVSDKSLSNDRVHVTVSESRRNRSPEFRIETNWPDGEVTECWMSYRDLKMFHDKVEKHFTEALSDDIVCIHLPQFPSKDTFLQSNSQTMDAIRAYFRELILLPTNANQVLKLRRIFQDLSKQPDSAVVSVSLSSSAAPLCLSVGKTDASLSAPPSPHSGSPHSLLPSVNVSKTTSKLPVDSAAKFVVSVTASQLTSATLQSSRSNHLLESMSNNVSLSQNSSLPLSRSSSYLPSQNSRSRHNSSQGYNSIALWLKDIRLHKYTDQLSKYSWEQLLRLTDSDLQREGFTSGACKKFANEIQRLKEKFGDNLESLLESTSSSRPCNLSGNVSPSQPSAPLATLLAKSAPGMSSPGSIDSSCSEYSTPPGSPEPRQPSGYKSRNRGGCLHQAVLNSNTSKEKEKVFVPNDSSYFAPATPLPDTASSASCSDVPISQSASTESSLVHRYSTESIRQPFMASTDAAQCGLDPVESSGSASVAASDHFAPVANASAHESVPVSQASFPMMDVGQNAFDPTKVPAVHPGLTALTSWQVGPPGQIWPAHRVMHVVRPQVPHVGPSEAPALGSRSHLEMAGIGQKLPENAAGEFVEEVAANSTGFGARQSAQPVLDSPVPPLPIPSDAVLVRPRLPVGPQIARLPPMVTPIPRFHDLPTSGSTPVSDSVSTSCSPFIGSEKSTTPRVPLQPLPPQAVLYPPVIPVSPAFHPPTVISPMMPGTQTKPGYLAQRDLPDIHNPVAVLSPPPTFPVDHSSPADSRLIDMSNPPSGMPAFIPGLFHLQSPTGNLQMVPPGIPYSISVTSSTIASASHTVSQNAVAFVATEDVPTDDAFCRACGQYLRQAQSLYQNVWPMESMFLQSPCFSVGAGNLVSPQHGSPQFRPMCGTQVPYRLPNGISPELHYQGSCGYSITGTRPMHGARPACAGPVPQYLFRYRAGAVLTVVTCSNCGAGGHTHLECKEPTVDSVLGTGQFHLNLVPKTETG